MRLIRIAREAMRALATNKLRTFFMMAGTVVGIAALTIIMGISEGTQRKIMGRMEQFGPRAMMLVAGGGQRAPGPDLSTTTLEVQDAEAIRREVGGLEIVTPMAWRFRMNLKRSGKQHQSVVWGVEPDWHQSFSWYTKQGEGITADDVATQSRVCVIGQTVKRELFGDTDPIGKFLYINDVRLEVKGVLSEKGASPGGGDFDNRIVLPITAAMNRVMNVDHLGAIRIVSAEPSRMPQQLKQIKELMRQQHHIGSAEEDDFRVITSEILRKRVASTSQTLSILLVALVGLSLLVGGVVLMNILLISVAERTSEIGLRRALGASQDDIFTQFLIESLTVTLLGMAAGAGIGWAVCVTLPRLTSMPVALSWQPFILGVTFALVVGLIFGVQPARRAAKLNPVEALR